MAEDYFGVMQEFLEEHAGVCSICDDCLTIQHPAYSIGKMPAMPVIQACAIDTSAFEYIGFQHTRDNDNSGSIHKTVGFFRADSGFEVVRNRPWRYTGKLVQYKYVMSPDFSVYYDTSIDEQWLSVYLNRLIGAYWQKCGLTVVPTIAWGDAQSFAFCFQGLEQGSTVAISTIGAKKHSEDLFMAGFIELCKRVRPACIICYCKPFPAMHDYANILFVEHEGTAAKRRARERILQATPFLPFGEGFQLCNTIQSGGK